MKYIPLRITLYTDQIQCMVDNKLNFKLIKFCSNNIKLNY